MSHAKSITPKLVTESDVPSTQDSSLSTPIGLRIPGEHAFVPLIRDYLKEMNVDLDQAEVEDENEIRWGYTTDAGISIIYRIYRTETEMFLHFEVAASKLDGGNDPMVLRWLCEMNNSFHFPLRLAVTQKELVVIQFRSYCGGITPEHCKLRIESLVPFALDIQDRLKRHFGLLPFLHERPTFDK